MKSMNIRRWSGSALLLGSVSLLSACGTLDLDVTDRVDYKNSKTVNSLEVPPDLDAPEYDSTYANIPGGAVSANALARGDAQVNTNTVLPTNAGIQLMREGNVRWLKINVPAEQVWPKLREFWRSMGIALKRDEPRVGIMETEWAENRGEIPQDAVRRSLGRVFEGMFDAGSRDRFKIRLERPAQNVTQVYLSHQRAEEIVTGSSAKWQYVPARPELEGEILNRLQVFLQGGKASAETPQATEARQTSVPVAMTQLDGGQPALVVGGAANAVWIRTGVMLGRIGLDIEQQLRDRGIYVVNYKGDDGQEKQGLFSRLFKTDKDMLKVGSRYQVLIADAGNRSVITLGDEDGEPLKAGVAKGLLERLKSEFER